METSHIFLRRDRYDTEHGEPEPKARNVQQFSLKELFRMTRARMSRSHYWICCGIEFSIGFVGGLLGLDPTLKALGHILGFVITFIATARRLHDLNWNGLWAFLVKFPTLGWFASQSASPDVVLFGIWFVAIRECAALLLLGCIPGTYGPNRFGPDPLTRDDSREVEVQQ